MVKVELFEISIVLTENTDEGRILKVFSEHIFWNRAIVTMKSSITVVALKTRSFFQTPVAMVLLLLHQVLQSCSDIHEFVLIFIIHDILVVLETVLVEIDTAHFISWIECFLESNCKIRCLVDYFGRIFKNEWSDQKVSVHVTLAKGAEWYEFAICLGFKIFSFPLL